MSSNISLVIRREYLERVRKKSFIITTILIPVLMILLMVAPAWVMSLNTSGAKKIAVVASGEGLEVAKELKGSDNLTFCFVSMPVDSIMGDKEYDGILQIGADIVNRPDDARLFTHDAPSLELTSGIERQLESIIENRRINAYGIDDLKNIINEVQVNVSLPTSRITDSNEATDSSSMLSVAIAFVMTFVLYMFLLMYGQMVMNSIIEEKNNRVLEIMVSSVKPSHLMMGKIVGVGLVAVTQVLIWAALIGFIVAALLPAVLPASIMGDVAAYSSGAADISSLSGNAELVQAIATFGSLGYIFKIFGYMTLFLIGGFLLYASMNAAFGSAVDNVQDAGQLQIFTMLPIILGLIFAMGTVNDPNSTIAVVFSYIPFTSPMVMLARIPFDIPAWQIWTSLVLLYASFVGMVWLAAKIYRIGIFMYGKKPTIKELIRWARYK